MDKEDQERDCDSCIHYKEKNRGLYVMYYCEAWECEYKPKTKNHNSEIYKQSVLPSEDSQV